jgi:hypothetical protein
MFFPFLNGSLKMAWGLDAKKTNAKANYFKASTTRHTY